MPKKDPFAAYSPKQLKQLAVIRTTPPHKPPITTDYLINLWDDYADDGTGVLQSTSARMETGKVKALPALAAQHFIMNRLKKMIDADPKMAALAGETRVQVYEVRRGRKQVVEETGYELAFANLSHVNRENLVPLLNAVIPTVEDFLFSMEVISES